MRAVLHHHLGRDEANADLRARLRTTERALQIKAAQARRLAEELEEAEAARRCVYRNALIRHLTASKDT